MAEATVSVRVSDLPIIVKLANDRARLRAALAAVVMVVGEVSADKLHITKAMMIALPGNDADRAAGVGAIDALLASIEFDKELAHEG